ncbi:MAG: efflux RND transporter periplasmic adaptor subunit [Phycisphaerales bacterium]|nr:efflux RND transporter periplasmic adaptor subunit [Phycisphaerales bacterium]
MAIGLKTAEVDFGQVEDVVRLTGMVRSRPDATYTIAPTYAGVVRSIAVQPGDRVTKGMVVAELDIPELARLMYDLKRLESEYEKLLSDVTRAESQIASLEIEAPALVKGAELAEAEVRRPDQAGESVSANLLAQRKAEALRLRADAGLRAVALTQAKAEVGSLKRQAETTRAAANALRGTLPRSKTEASTDTDSDGQPLADPARPGLLRFVSPIDGVVVSRTAGPGVGVSAGAPILTIGNFQSVQIEGEVPEGLIDRLSSRPHSVRIRRGVSETSEVVGEGVVRFISPVIDATKRTAHLIVDVENPAGLLRQGQFVDLSVVLSASDSAVVVPASAIVKEGPLQYVFVKEGKGENEAFKKRDVATGVRDGRVVEIKLGLVPGDVIAVSGAFSLSQLRGFVAGPGAQSQRHRRSQTTDTGTRTDRDSLLDTRLGRTPPC